MAEEPAPAGAPENAPAPTEPTAPIEQPAATDPTAQAAPTDASAAPATPPVEAVAPSETPVEQAAAEAPVDDAAAAQAALDALAAATSSGDPAPASPEAPAGDPFAAAVGDAGGFDQSAIDELLKQANFEDPSALPAEAHVALPETSNFELPNFQQAMQDAQVSSIDLLRDVELNVKIELGRSRMLVEDVLKLGEGSVVELDKLAGDPVDVFVNERLVARGEVLVLNDNFCVRVNEIVAGAREDMV
jgi:flagellar motor switch protein FliN/FliY